MYMQTTLMLECGCQCAQLDSPKEGLWRTVTGMARHSLLWLAPFLSSNVGMMGYMDSSNVVMSAISNRNHPSDRGIEPNMFVTIYPIDNKPLAKY